MTTAEIIEIITTAGLDHHDFKCQYAADRANEGDLIWVAIAEMARTTAASRLPRPSCSASKVAASRGPLSNSTSVP